ncbi:MAG TPA: tetratricopeptide repeat protein [Streptosporangiaceae bacterium]|nr:tetratricopeptide repeat protein [Streptosporangiaceae bacterium]
MSDPPVVTFGQLLRLLRAKAGLTQQELAERARLGVTTVSDLEREVALTAQKATAERLANALGLTGPDGELFVAVARGRALAGAFPAPRTRAGGVAAATRTLPRDIASFTGREPELRQLAGVIAGAARTGGVGGIHVIGGMAGVGKTAFAVHVAHQLAPRFPDGQIFLLLHGHTPGQRPVDLADALASLLLMAGVPVSHIPPGLDARMARWRDWLDGRQLLLLLDDAADSEQVRPLLPGSAGSLVLVTSRRRLTALEDAQAISLDTLSPREAAQLLVRLAARPGLGPDDPAVAEITRLCGHLPLAVGMLARQLQHHPTWTARGLAGYLAAARDRLALMHTENLSVAAAFDLSYHELTPGQQRLFRRLGLHPGPDTDTYAAAALDGTGLAVTRRHLDALYEQYLITEPTQGWYRFHDLVREYARALAATDQRFERDAAMARLFDYYQHTAALAEALLARQTRPGPAPTTPPTLPVFPDLDDARQALAWARANRASLLACLDHAARTDQHARVIALTAGLAGLLRHDGPWADAITCHAAAIQAARNLGDQRGQANALTYLGDVQRLTGDYPGAARALEQALSIYRDLGDQRGQANALTELGDVRSLTGDYPDAAQALEQALDIYRDLGHRLGQARALTRLGDVWRLTGDYPDAAQALKEALDIFRGLGERLGQARALNRRGVVWRLTGDYPRAAQAQEQALDIYRDLGERLGQANALTALGVVWRLTGDYPGAAQAQVQALDIYRDLGDRGGEAEVLNETGILHRVSGELAQAKECHQQALELARTIASSWDEANALAGLGRCDLAAGRTTDARIRLQQALDIFQRIGAAEATSVTAELGAIPQAEPPP